MDELNFLNEVGGSREIAVRALVGSHNYNLNNERSDRDYKFFVYPSFDDLYNGTRFSTAKQSCDFDYDVHDVRSLVSLISKANLNFIEVLYSTDKMVDWDFRFLFSYADLYATANLPDFYNATFGMAHQKMKELHKGTAKTDVLISEFGYDTKQASHALRCLYTLSRLMASGNMKNALWYNNDDPDRDVVLKVKNGFFSENDFLALVDDWKKSYDVETKKFFQAQSVNRELLDYGNYKIKEVIKARF